MLNKLFEPRCIHRHTRAEHPQCFNIDGTIKKKTQVINTSLDVKVGILDIETLPAISYHWGLYDQNISVDKIIQDTCLLSWAGKYLNESDVYSDILTPNEALTRNPQRVANSAFKFLSTCQFVVGHNFRSFDGKILNNYFLLYAKPLKYQIIDTLEIARNNFKFMSNKLSFINKKLGIRDKIETDGFSLWKDCSNGVPQALNTMLRYNKGDVLATEDLYYKLRAFMPRHPNLAIYNELETEQCPVCTGTNLVITGRYGVYESVRCDSCGAISRRKTNILTKEKRRRLLV